MFYISEENTNMLLKSGWEEFSIYLLVDRKMSPKKSNQQILKSRFNKICDYFNDKQFDRDNFNRFIASLQEKHYANSYINGFIKVAKHLDKHLKINCLTDYTYFREERNQVIDTLTTEEIKKLAELEIAYRKNSKEINLRYRTLIYFLGMTGCRVGEAISLKWVDVHQNPRMVIFRDTKNGDTRYVPISEFLYNMMHELPKEGATVFNLDYIQEINHDLRRRAELLNINKDVHCHLFRHSFITELLKQGCSITMVAKIVGHRDVNTTANRYTHLVISDMENALYSYHPLLRESQTFDMLSNRVKDTLSKMVDKLTYSISIEERGKTLQIKIVNK